MNTSISALLERERIRRLFPAAGCHRGGGRQGNGRHRVGAILVIEDGRIVGIFTERDVLSRVVATGIDPKTTPIGVRPLTARDPIHGGLRATTVEEVMALFTNSDSSPAGRRRRASGGAGLDRRRPPPHGG